MGSERERSYDRDVMPVRIRSGERMMGRRGFVCSLGALGLAGMGAGMRVFAGEAAAATGMRGRRIAAGADRDGKPLRLGGVTPTDTKVSGDDVGGGMYLFEHRGMRGGGPPEHLHYEQDEWFYAIEGTFGFRVGGEPFVLNAGDLIFLPRKVPHVWAHVGEAPGTILGCVTPAGTFEAFFRRIGGFTSPPAPEVAERIFAEHGMKIVGPPYEVV